MSRPIRSAHTSSSTLARERVASDLTQAQLAEQSGVAQPTISRYERSSDRPPYDIAQRIAGALGFSVAHFWPTLERDVNERGRLLDTVIPAEHAFTPAAKAKRRQNRVVYQDPDGGHRAKHVHRPPICCGAQWCRCVDLSNPETFPIFGDPKLIEFAAGGVNG